MMEITYIRIQIIVYYKPVSRFLIHGGLFVGSEVFVMINILLQHSPIRAVNRVY